MKRIALFLFTVFIPVTPAFQANAEEPKLKDLKGFFPFEVPADLETWEERAALLKRRVLVANGLFPLPERTPLNAVIHGKIERPGFTVEKVYFESVPGLHVTGLLFRPANAKPGQKFPTVLSPHGHGGRLQDHGEQGILKQIETGGEKFAQSGRFPKVARCGNLARLGCVTLLFDMVGYADNQQLSRQLGHGLKLRRPNFESKESWGFFSAQAELRLQSIFGLQTWNAVRAIDFLESLPDVDPTRIAVTGGSGGGTQSIMVCAIDDRPVAAFPNGMVSSSMQGGCTCENASLLRIGTGNVELAALFAPKPQGMTAANDWTKEMFVPGKGFPELKKLYTLYGKPGNVFCGDLLRFKHNYNVVTREYMYQWFNTHLSLGHSESIEEQDFKILTAEEHAVYNKTDHPRPEGGGEFEKKLIGWLTAQSDKQIAELPKADRSRLVTKAWQTMIGLDDQVAPSEFGIDVDGVVTVSVDIAAAKPKETQVVSNPREIAAYTHGYNHSYFANQVREVYAKIKGAEAAGYAVEVKAAPGSEAIALAACVICKRGTVRSVQIPDDSFRFMDVESYRSPDFVPGAVKYRDLPGLIETVKWLGTEVSVK